MLKTFATQSQILGGGFRSPIQFSAVQGGTDVCGRIERQDKKPFMFSALFT